MPLEAFNSSASIIDVLTGGVNSVGRSLLLGQQGIQTNTVRSIEESFASRIDEAIARLNQTDTNPKISALRREQSILASRKERLNQAIELLNKTLTQTNFIKKATEHLADLLDDLEAGTITSSSMATVWDNTLRIINNLVEDATVTYKDGGVSYEKNLIKSDGSRTRFPNRSFLAPFNSNGDTLLISGSYLGTDYFLQEFTQNVEFPANSGNFISFVGDTFWNSDTAFLDTEAATGTLTEFASQAGFPDSPTGVTASVTAAGISFFNLVRNENGNFIAFETTGGGRSLATITTGGLGLLDAWMYNDFNDTDDTPLNRDATFTRQFAKDDLEQALGKILLAEAQFRLDVKTLQSRANLFDPQIAGIEREISNITETSLSENEAIVVSLKLAFQVAQFNLAILASRGSTLVSSLLLSLDNFNNGLGSSFKATGDALLGATLSIQA